MSPTATATSPLDGLAIHHDSEVRVEETYVGDDDQQMHDVLLDGEHVGGGLLRDDADRYAGDIERRIKHLRLVRDARELIDWIEQHCNEIAALDGMKIHAHFSGFFGSDKLDKLSALAQLLGEYHGAVENDYTVRLDKVFGDAVKVTGYAYQAALPPEQPKPSVRLPELPGRNLAAEPETQAA